MNTARSIMRELKDDPGVGAITGSLICEWLEGRGRWLVLVFAAACTLFSIILFLEPGAWVFGLLPALWAIVAVSGRRGDHHQVSH